MELLPLEILYLIIEKLDTHTFVNCLHVSKTWKSIALRIADKKKNNQRWQSIFELYHEEETFRVKSNKLLTHKELFANSLRWNLNFSLSLVNTCSVNQIRKINVYADNIIVINNVGVKYYDVETFKIKMELAMAECIDFMERDAMILRATMQDKECKLLLYGKRSPNDKLVAAQIVQNMGVALPTYIIIRAVCNYVLENDSCYVLNSFNVLTCYIWKEKWNIHRLGRYYTHDIDTLAMNVLKSDVILFTKWGQLVHFCYEKRNFQLSCRFRMTRKTNGFFRLVHKYCVVIGVPDNCEFRITRFRNNEGYNLYKFECPNLTCVMQHGEMIFLGYNDGKIEIFMPRALSREDMFKRRMHISDFISDEIKPEDLAVVSIDVYEDFEKHHSYIATYSNVYHLKITHPDGDCVWDNIPERVMYYMYPLSTQFVL